MILVGPLVFAPEVGLPRMRGDDPNRMLFSNNIRMFAPHARG